MKLILFTLSLALLAACAMAYAPASQRSVIITYEDPNTPDSVLAQAKKAIEEAGGIITHEYRK